MTNIIYTGIIITIGRHIAPDSIIIVLSSDDNKYLINVADQRERSVVSKEVEVRNVIDDSILVNTGVLIKVEVWSAQVALIKSRTETLIAIGSALVIALIIGQDNIGIA